MRELAGADPEQPDRRAAPGPETPAGIRRASSARDHAGAPTSRRSGGRRPARRCPARGRRSRRGRTSARSPPHRCASPATVAATNGGCRNSARSSIGAARRRSTSTKPPRANTATTPRTTTGARPSPSRPSTSAASSALIPTASEQRAGQVEPARCSERDSPTRRCPAQATATAPTAIERPVRVAPAEQPVEPGGEQRADAIPAPTRGTPDPARRARARTGRDGSQR